MIHIGLDTASKSRVVGELCQREDINRVVIISTIGREFPCAHSRYEVVTYEQVIQYAYFYRLLQEIDKRTLVVVNECLRTQNRHDLTYNCIRHFLNQAGHVLVFQYLPLIDTAEDFSILFDFDTQSRWKRSKFADLPLEEARLEVAPRRLEFSNTDVRVSPSFRARYLAEKERLFANLGASDPHTLPRNLHLFTGRPKLGAMDPSRQYVCRNGRFNEPSLTTYENAQPGREYAIFEWCHRYIDFTDFLWTTGQDRFDVLSTDLPVDQWYLQRYTDWRDKLDACYSAIQR